MTLKEVKYLQYIYMMTEDLLLLYDVLQMKITLVWSISEKKRTLISSSRGHFAGTLETVHCLSLSFSFYCQVLQGARLEFRMMRRNICITSVKLHTSLISKSGVQLLRTNLIQCLNIEHKTTHPWFYPISYLLHRMIFFLWFLKEFLDILNGHPRYWRHCEEWM